MEPLSLALALAQFAPSLMRYFGAGEKPVAVASAAIEIAKRVTGAASGEDALAAIQADPAKALEYRKAVLEADRDLEQAYLADRQDARRRDILLHQAGYQNRRADIMVALDAIGLVACLVVLAVMHSDLPGEVLGLLSTIAGIFGVCLRDAHQFEFGSSRGSREKDALLGERAGGKLG